MLFGRLFELRIGIFTARSLNRIKKSNRVLNKKEQNNQVPRQKIKKSIGSLVLLAGRLDAGAGAALSRGGIP
jgi:hypothetical protein